MANQILLLFSIYTIPGKPPGLVKMCSEDHQGDAPLPPNKVMQPDSTECRQFGDSAKSSKEGAPLDLKDQVQLAGTAQSEPTGSPQGEASNIFETFEYAFYELGSFEARDDRYIADLDWLYKGPTLIEDQQTDETEKRIVPDGRSIEEQRRLSTLMKHSSPLPFYTTHGVEPLVRRASLDSTASKKKIPTKEYLALRKSVMIWGPLPIGFEMHLTERGRPFFFNIFTLISSWDDPRGALPAGWELLITDNIRFVYINPILRIATLDHPVMRMTDDSSDGATLR